MRGGRRGGRRWIGLALLLLLAPPAAADARAERQLDDLEALLTRGEHLKVIERSERLRARLVARAGADDAALEPAARTLVLQAIAEANLGRDDVALWHWYAAQSYLPHLPELDLAAYGRAREILEGRAVADLPASQQAPAAPEGARYRAVRIRHSVEPTYPKSLRRSGRQGKVRLKLVVDASGEPRRPVVLDGGLVPAMAFPVLDSLANWRFDPATEDGNAVPVWYEIEVAYR